MHVYMKTCIFVSLSLCLLLLLQLVLTGVSEPQLRKSVEDIAASLGLKLPTFQVPVTPALEHPTVTVTTPAPTVTFPAEGNAAGDKLPFSSGGESEEVGGKTYMQSEEASGPVEGAYGEGGEDVSKYTGFDDVVRRSSSEYVVHSFANAPHSSTVGSTVANMAPQAAHHHYALPRGRCLG